MNNAIKRNQSQSNIELDFISDKLNSILITLDSEHIISNYVDKVVEDEAHKFDGITYENKVLSESISAKIQHNNELIDQIMSILIKSEEISDDDIINKLTDIKPLFKEEILSPPSIRVITEEIQSIPPQLIQVKTKKLGTGAGSGGFKKGHKGFTIK